MDEAAIPTVPGMTVEEYQASAKNVSGRAAAASSRDCSLDCAFQCSLDAGATAGDLYQDPPKDITHNAYVVSALLHVYVLV